MEAQSRKGTMLKSHSMWPCLGHGRSFVCFWPQLANSFDWNSRLRSIQDAVGSWKDRIACMLGIHWAGPDPWPAWDTAKAFLFCTHDRGTRPPGLSEDE